jgi:hypothetical protein
VARRDDVAVRVVEHLHAGSNMVQDASVRVNISEAVEAPPVFSRDKRGDVLATGEEIQRLNVEGRTLSGIRYQPWDLVRQHDANKMSVLAPLFYADAALLVHAADALSRRRLGDPDSGGDRQESEQTGLFSDEPGVADLAPILWTHS